MSINAKHVLQAKKALVPLLVKIDNISDDVKKMEKELKNAFIKTKKKQEKLNQRN